MPSLSDTHLPRTRYDARASVSWEGSGMTSFKFEYLDSLEPARLYAAPLTGTVPRNNLGEAA